MEVVSSLDAALLNGLLTILRVVPLLSKRAEE
jgi:hypothetical protein